MEYEAETENLLARVARAVDHVATAHETKSQIPYPHHQILAVEMDMSNRLELHDRFRHHSPSHAGILKAHDELRAVCRAVATTIEELCPDGREKALAFTKIEEAMFWANAAVARKQEAGYDDQEQPVREKGQA